MIIMKLEDRMKRSITQRAGLVVLSSDFAAMGSPSQVGRVITRLVEAGRLVKVSKGAYAKARINRFTGKPAPAGTLEAITGELFKKLGIAVAPSSLVNEYNSGKSTQLPMRATVSTGSRRITRNVTVGNRTLAYENNSKRA
jgi:hypothetical protein